MRVIRGRVFYRGRLEPLSVGVDDGGRIATIKKVLRGEDETDFGDAIIVPGCVDLHVHMREPGLTHKEDLASGTRSAAIGGVTTIAEMPNTKPPVTNRPALRDKEGALKGRALIDYLLYGAPRSPDAVSTLADAAAFKIYMAESTGGLQVDPQAVGEILRAAERAKKLTVVHAEDPRAFTRALSRGLEGYAIVRPKEAEVKALSFLGEVRGAAPVHAAHVTTVEALDATPSGVTTEVTPHHLFLDWTKPLGARGKVNPPLRSREDRDALWAAFRQGRGDIVASDHAPHTLDEKEEPFDEAPAGIPGVATSFPLLMRRVHAGELDLARLVSAMATRPAELIGIRKGEIEIGFDADLLAVDPRRTELITANRVGYKCGWTPFERMEGCFPLAVFLRGEAIVESGEVSAEGGGRLLRSPAR